MGYRLHGQQTLKPEQVRDIRLYLSAHKWNGAVKAIAKKHGVDSSMISRIKRNQTYKENQDEL